MNGRRKARGGGAAGDFLTRAGGVSVASDQRLVCWSPVFEFGDGPGLRLRLCQGLFDVGDQVIRFFNPYRKPDEFIGDADRFTVGC